MAESKSKKNWGSRFGVIMAVAGSAIGLGNFLRFPGQAVANGGGAFLIPYFISLFLLGIPLVWVEWTVGRYGGGFGHSTAPGVFHSLWQKNRFIKYFGLIGIFGPLLIFIYYVYIVSWTLAYSFFAFTGKLTAIGADQEGFKAFLAGFQGIVENDHFSSLLPAYIFFVITFGINVGILYRGVQEGIEKFCKIAMPILLIFAIFLLIRVLTLGIPDASRPSWNVSNGLGFLWNPNFEALKDARVWLAAAGQIFFTLSVGIGCILTYASYLSKGDDVALSGLSAVSTNEFAEIILGGSIVVVASFVFFGDIGAKAIADEGIFNLGFVTMPMIFSKLAFSQLLAFLWFFLLFLAGITSSISVAEPAIAFIEDEFNVTRKRAVAFFAIATFLLCHISIFLLKNGAVDELDFWGGTFCLVVFATVETILFAWVFGIDKAWDEIHHGADLRVPRIYKFIIKYITPTFLFLILGFWLSQKSWDVLTLKHVADADKPYVIFTRVVIVTIVIVLAILLKIAWQKKNSLQENRENNR